MEAINGSAGAARNSHQLEGGPSSDRHVKKLFVTIIAQRGGGMISETGLLYIKTFSVVAITFLAEMNGFVANFRHVFFLGFLVDLGITTFILCTNDIWSKREKKKKETQTSYNKNSCLKNTLS